MIVTKEMLNEKLISSADYDELDDVRYVLTYPHFSGGNADIHFNNDKAFHLAVSKNNFDIVVYLLTSPELKEHANIHAQDDCGLIYAADLGYLKLVQFLLTSPLLKEHANIHAKNDQALKRAVTHGHLSVVKFLLTSKKLKDKADLHCSGDFCIREAFLCNRSEILKFLLPLYSISELDFLIDLRNQAGSEPTQKNISILDEYLIKSQIPHTQKKNKKTIL